MSEEVRMLPKPVRREQFLFPIPLYGANARVQVPEDMTHAEAVKIGRALVAMAALTSCNARSLS